MSAAAHPSMDVDIVCVGFGPAAAGFLTTLSRALAEAQGEPAFASRAVPGMPLQVVCYERADDVAFGVSGVVTRARAIRASFPALDPRQIPLAHPVTHEEVLYLLDPVGASRRSPAVRCADRCIRRARALLPGADQALRLPYLPGFLRKTGGLVFSAGQFLQWVANQLVGAGMVQIWPGMPVASPLLAGEAVVGVRLADQGTDRNGRPAAGYLPGLDVRAALTVVADGPCGPVGRQLDARFGLPAGHHQREWAVGMKMVIDLPAACAWRPGTVIHTLGYPEPEVFGFVYVLAERVAAAGIFVPSWLDSPLRAPYRYLQCWLQHPALWPHVGGGAMRSWGAKSLLESGARGEPWLAGDGYARIGEGSGSTNVLTGSGIDEAWATGVQLAEGVIELLRERAPFTRANLERAYVARRRRSWVEREGRRAAHARDGFERGFAAGVLGMAMVGLTGGRLRLPGRSRRPHERVPALEEYCRGRVDADRLASARQRAATEGIPLHGLLLPALGWPEVPLDGRLLVSHQDALLLGGKVQAPPGFADHVVFVDPELCAACDNRLCIEACSGQAIMPGSSGVPQFDRDKCVHCGACLWNCTRASRENPERANVEFRAGAGGLHSAEN